MVAALVAKVAEEPAIVVVEDTHWMDEPSRGLLDRVSMELRGSPWLLIITRRPGQDGYVATDGDALHSIDLQPLATEQAVELIHAATEEAPLMSQQVRVLAERAAGNPLFLIELLDALRRGEDVETMPTSVEGLIHARIDRLPSADRSTLRALSVLGTGFRLEHAAAALASGEDQSIATSLRGFGDFLTVDRVGWVQFRHALIRDAACTKAAVPPAPRAACARRGRDPASGRRARRGAGRAALRPLLARAPLGRGLALLLRRRRPCPCRVRHRRGVALLRALFDSAARLGTVNDGARIGVATRLGEALEYAGLFEPALDALRRVPGVSPARTRSR